MSRYERLTVTELEGEKQYVGGPSDSDGTWSVRVNSDGDLEFAKRIDGTYVVAQTVTVEA